MFISSRTPTSAVSTYDASVGGNQDFPTTSRSLLNEGGDEFAWLSPSGAHRIKVGFLINHGSGRNDVSEEKNGVFFFNSLADLAAGTPSSFTRVLSASLRSSSRTGAALYAGDAWQPHSGLEIDYGVRLERSTYGAAPADNAAVVTTFGLHTGRFPTELHLSPRVGFTYSSGGDKEESTGWRLRGGFGEFRGTIPDAIFSNAAQSTGLPDGQTRLTCTGASVPTPDWRAYLADPSTIPRSCVGVAHVTADNLPSLVVFAAQAESPRTWRSSLGATHGLVGPFTASLDLFHIDGVSQLGIPDLNLKREPAFTLSTEAGRPVSESTLPTPIPTSATSRSASRAKVPTTIRSEALIFRSGDAPMRSACTSSRRR